MDNLFALSTDADDVLGNAFPRWFLLSMVMVVITATTQINGCCIVFFHQQNLSK